MKKSIVSLFLAVSLFALSVTGCGTQNEQEKQLTEMTEAETQKEDEADDEADENASEEALQTEETLSENNYGEGNGVTYTVASLKGPTSMGLAAMMYMTEENDYEAAYEFVMETSADTLLPMILKKEADIALVPANVAGVLYNKTQALEDEDSHIVVLDVNTLGVLYMVTGSTDISDMKDLAGKTIYLTGKGTTPDYVLNYLLEANEVLDVTLEYKSEAAEVAAVLAENPEAIGLLPQPFVTVACMQNENLSIVLDMNKEWDKVQGEGGSSLVTGVTVTTKGFLREHGDVIEQFMAKHKASIEYVVNNPEEAATLVVKAGIVEKEPVAAKAIPYCNLTYLEKQEMKQALSGYLTVLYNQNPQSVGGALPGDDFYYE